MKEANPMIDEMMQQTFAKKRPISASPDDLDRALERIRQKYGNDLRAYIQDTKEALRRQREAADRAAGEPLVRA